MCRFLVNCEQKRGFGFLTDGFEPVRPQSRQRRVYHQTKGLDITKAKALYIIIAKEDTACG